MTWSTVARGQTTPGRVGCGWAGWWIRLANAAHREEKHLLETATVFYADRVCYIVVGVCLPMTVECLHACFMCARVCVCVCVCVRACVCVCVRACVPVIVHALWDGLFA